MPGRSERLSFTNYPISSYIPALAFDLAGYIGREPSSSSLRPDSRLLHLRLLLSPYPLQACVYESQGKQLELVGHKLATGTLALPLSAGL